MNFYVFRFKGIKSINKHVIMMMVIIACNSPRIIKMYVFLFLLNDIYLGYLLQSPHNLTQRQDYPTDIINLFYFKAVNFHGLFIIHKFTSVQFCKCFIYTTRWNWNISFARRFILPAPFFCEYRENKLCARVIVYALC